MQKFFCTQLYNKEHYHSGVGYVTPEQQHTGEAKAILQHRKKQLTAARNKRIKYWRSQPLTDGGLQCFKTGFGDIN